MIENSSSNRDRSSAATRAPQGERWRKYLERLGTHSNDFAGRVARARFVYLHRREVASHWLPL